LRQAQYPLGDTFSAEIPEGTVAELAPDLAEQLAGHRWTEWGGFVASRSYRDETVIIFTG
jgi:hypothetical protein